MNYQFSIEENILSEVQERNVTKVMIVKLYRSWNSEIQIKLEMIKSMKGQLMASSQIGNLKNLNTCNLQLVVLHKRVIKIKCLDLHVLH